MNHGVEIAVAEKAFRAGPVSEVKREKPESRPHAELPKPRILEPRVVVVVQVVHSNNLESICEKAVDEVGANETSGTSDQNSFVSCLLHQVSLSLTASVSQLPNSARLTNCMRDLHGALIERIPWFSSGVHQ
jgi:hypothetical protein